MEQNPELAQYADNYNKIFETLYTTHVKEKDLEEQCTNLEERLFEAENKLEIAKRIAETDAETINDLKEQIQHAWKLTDAAHEREQAAQEMIEMLRKQVANLNAEIDFKNRMGQEESEE